MTVELLKRGNAAKTLMTEAVRCKWTGRFICGWRGGFAFLSANELSDDIQLLFGGAEAMKVTWLVAIKEEAAREGLAREEHIVQLLNQHVEEVIVLDSGDEADDGRPMPPIGLWRPSSARRNAIILFFDEMADEEGRGGRASLDTGVASAGAASSDAGAATSSSGHGTHLAKKLKLSQQEELQRTVSEQEGLEVAMALSASLETVSEQEGLEVSMAISASLEVDTLENMTDTLENDLSKLLPGAGACVLRFDANQDKGELLAKMIALAQTNMSRYLTEPEEADALSRVGAEIAASSVVSIEIGTALLGFAAYRIHEPEHGGVADKRFTYLFELHKDLSDPRTGGLGDLLEAEVTRQADGVSESMMLTVLNKNNLARRFYNKHGWFRFNKNRKRKSGYDIMVKEKLAEDLEDPGSSVFPHLQKMTLLKRVPKEAAPASEEAAPAEATPVSKEAVPEEVAPTPEEAAHAAPAEAAAAEVTAASAEAPTAAEEAPAAPAEAPAAAAEPPAATGRVPRWGNLIAH